MCGVTSSRFLTIFRLMTIVLAVSLAAAMPADAAKRKKRSGYNPPYAGIVVDAKTGRVLYADNVDDIRHPASLTKVMTLYILFDELDRGTLTLKTRLKVSAEASRQSPSKLGLKPGETISVEDAILALVTKSANDVAVTIAENISGSEEAFAKRMTRKARALGMKETVYANASGLPDDRQVTTARDLALLGRAIQDNHPERFDYFKARSFKWHGRNYANHNKLLGHVPGVDGIKTGFIRASGFNLLTSVNHKDRSIVAVVLGGKSGASRDAHMRDLIARTFDKATRGPRTAPLIAEAPLPAPPMPVVTASIAEPPALPKPRPDEAMPLPEPVRAAAPGAAPVVTAAIAPAEAAPAAPPPPAPVRNSTMTPDAIAQRIALATDLATSTTTTPQELGWMVGKQPVAVPSAASAYAGGTTPGSAAPRPRPTAVASVQTPRQVAVAANAPVQAGLYAAPVHPSMQPAPQTALAEPESQMEPAVAEPPPPGWQIQLAATPELDQAQNLLDRAAGTVRKIDRNAAPYTEPVQKDGVTLYRARFAGFSERGAEAACKAVKRANFKCFALKN